MNWYKKAQSNQIKPGTMVMFNHPVSGQPIIGKFEAIFSADSPSAGKARIRVEPQYSRSGIVVAPLNILKPYIGERFSPGEQVNVMGYPTENPATIVRMVDDQTAMITGLSGRSWNSAINQLSKIEV